MGCALNRPELVKHLRSAAAMNIFWGNPGAAGSRFSANIFSDKI
jgi:hypothetical protein